MNHEDRQRYHEDVVRAGLNERRMLVLGRAHVSRSAGLWPNIPATAALMLLAALFAPACLAGCGGDAAVDVDGGARRVSTVVCDPVTMRPVGTCTFTQGESSAPDCAYAICPRPDATCNVPTTVTAITPCPVPDYNGGGQ
jgi:hypothetical protein